MLTVPLRRNEPPERMDTPMFFYWLIPYIERAARWIVGLLQGWGGWGHW